ncbi:MAG: abortive infection family protein [Cyanobacteria bacterium P01_A01_bin.40]
MIVYVVIQSETSKIKKLMNYKNEIPAPVIDLLADKLPKHENDDALKDLFLHANAPEASKQYYGFTYDTKHLKTKAYLRRINRESENPLSVLGKLIECYVELPEPYENNDASIPKQHAWKKDFKDELLSVLQQCNMQYISGGIIADGRSISSKLLAELIKRRDILSIEAEFDRALKNVNSEPREAVSAACNILESIFKIYITDEGLKMPNKKDLQGVWKVVSADLGFDPGQLEDNDLKSILSGIISIVKGIGALRTHASSAHGQGRKSYKLKPRHARLAVNAAHTLAVFVLETWDEKTTNSH